MKQGKCLSILALFLAVILILPLPVSATESEISMPRASYYLDAYSAYVYVTSSGQVQVWFEVMGTGTMDEIGTLSIKLYESTDNVNWTRVKTFSHENYPSMLAYNDFYHTSYVSYQGSTAKYYKAYVCIWAGKDGSGDTRYMWAY